MKHRIHDCARVAVVALLLLIAVSVFALAANSGVRVVDQTGRTVSIPQPVTRIVSAYGISTYYVYALGAGDRIVNAWYVQIKGLSKAPDALWKMEPKLDEKLSFGTPNLEDIVSRTPDLVLTNPTKHGDLADRLLDLGIPAIQYVNPVRSRNTEGDEGGDAPHWPGAWAGDRESRAGLCDLL